MRAPFKQHLLLAGISALLVAPLTVLEGVNTGGFVLYGFPAALFVTLWVLTWIMLELLVAAVKGARSHTGIATFGFLLQITGIVIVGVMLGGLIADQMPCFLGVPNCD